MGEVVDFEPLGRAAEKIAERVDKRQDKRQDKPTPENSMAKAMEQDDYLRGQQVIANAIFHWKSDTSPDARAGVRFLIHHLATAFRADDTPLQPRPLAE